MKKNNLKNILKAFIYLLYSLYDFIYYYFFKIIKSKFLFKALVKHNKNEFNNYKCELKKDREFKNIFKELHLNHPLHHFELVPLDIGIPLKYRKEGKTQQYGFYLQKNKKKYLILFLIWGKKIHIFNYYMFFSINEEIIRIVLKEILSNFKVVHISFRSKVNYNLPFFKKVKKIRYYIDFTHSFDDYLCSLGKKTRFNLKYYDKKLNKDYNIEINYFSENELTIKQYEIFIELTRKRNYDINPWLYYLSTQCLFEAFKSCLVGIILMIDGIEASFSFFYKYHNILILKGTIFDEKFSKYSLGILTTYYYINHAFEQKVKTIIMGGLPTYGYKDRLSNNKHYYYEYDF